MRSLIPVFLCVLAQAQTSSNPGFRLGYVRGIYIESLGSSNEAKMVRDQIVGVLVNRSTLAVEGDKGSAHAILTGTAMVTSGEMHWAIGSASSGNSAAVVAAPGAVAASVASASTSRLSAGGGTIRITELGLQLSDEYGRLLWAFDPTGCGRFGTRIPRRNSSQYDVIVCAVEQMIKAINKDAKKVAKP